MKLKMGLFLLFPLVLFSCAPRQTLAATPTLRLPGMQEGRSIELNGQTVYYEAAGTGAPLVFIHGIGGGNSGYQWIKNAPEFIQNHRVYVMDLPGFGKSTPKPQNYTADLYVNTIKAFLKEVVQQEATVVASSLAGAYSIKIAHDSPELIGKLALVSPTGISELVEPPNTGFYDALLNTPLGGTVAAALRGRFGISFFLKQQVYLDQSLVTNDLKKVYQNNLKHPNAPYPVYSFISDYSNLNIEQEWKALKQPAVLFWGSDDVNTPAASAQRFVELRPEVKLNVLKARAIPNDERSAEFNLLLAEFLQGR